MQLHAGAGAAGVAGGGSSGARGGSGGSRAGGAAVQQHQQQQAGGLQQRDHAGGEVRVVQGRLGLRSERSTPLSDGFGMLRSCSGCA